MEEHDPAGDAPATGRQVDAPATDRQPDRPSRTVIFRDLLIFQVKLWLDGLKDVVLSPLSVIGFGIDVLFGRAMKGSVFYKVLKLGERYDLWLNLFGAAEKAEERRGGFLDPRAEDDRASLDDLLRRHTAGPTPAVDLRPPPEEETMDPGAPVSRNGPPAAAGEAEASDGSEEGGHDPRPDPKRRPAAGYVRKNREEES
jgi:hypothetical protein